MEEDEENAVTTVSMDYMFMNEKNTSESDKEKESAQPIIVIRDRNTNTALGHMANDRLQQRLGGKADPDGYRGHRALRHQR